MAGQASRRQRGPSHARLAISKTTHKAQIDSSNTWPRLEVVSTEYQEQVSATTINGTMARDTRTAAALPTTCPTPRSSKAHCAAKHSSATVATERPTITVESHESTMTWRCTS